VHIFPQAAVNTAQMPLCKSPASLGWLIPSEMVTGPTCNYYRSLSRRAVVSGFNCHYDQTATVAGAAARMQHAAPPHNFPCCQYCCCCILLDTPAGEMGCCCLPGLVSGRATNPILLVGPQPDSPQLLPNLAAAAAAPAAAAAAHFGRKLTASTGLLTSLLMLVMITQDLR
jgi:hypothetical protein